MSGIGTSHRGSTALASLLLVTMVCAGAASADSEGRGAVLFGNCTQCHGEQGAGDRLSLAPAIAGLEEWYVLSQLSAFRSGARASNQLDLPGLRMRPMSRSLHSEEDVKLVATYVASLPPVEPAPVLEGGDPQRGAATYNALCAQCHGADGAGDQTKQAPRLRHINDWYLASSLERYKAGIRGSNPPFGPVMQGMARALLDDQAVKDVVAYIVTLGN